MLNEGEGFKQESDVVYFTKIFFWRLYDKYCLGETERKLGRSLVAVVAVKKCVDGSLFSDV